MKVDLFSVEGNGPASKSKSCSAAHKLQEFKMLAYRFALTDILSRRSEFLVHKDEVHQHPECICTKIVHKMRLVFWKNKKTDSDNVLASCNNSKRCPALRYYCPNVSQLVCNQRKHATRCSQVIGWLVWMGLMSAFQIWCEFLKKRLLSLFVGIFCWGQ